MIKEEQSILQELYNHFHQMSENVKRENRIAVNSLLIPNEIILAAGMTPYRLFGTEESISTEVSSKFNNNMCSYVLYSLSEAIKKYGNEFNKVVLADTCDTRKKMYEVWKHFYAEHNLFLINAPKVENELNKSYYKQEIKNLIQYMEDNYSVSITDEKLREAIKICNETRKLLQEVNDLSRSYPSILSTNVRHDIIRASYNCDSRVFNQVLSDFLEELKKRENEDISNRVQVLITGSFFDNKLLFNLIEEYGGIVVCENNSMGYQYYNGQINLDQEVNSLDAITDFYFNKAIENAYLSTDAYTSCLLELLDKYKVKNVIYTSLKFCDCNALNYSYIRKVLLEHKYSVLNLELEHSISNVENIRTRIETFLEKSRWS